VECTVRVSPILARLIRKSAAAEAEGAPPLDALLTPVGSRAGEVEQLRDQIKQLADELGIANASVGRLRQDVDVSRTDLANCVQQRIELERRLKTANTLDEKHRAKMADAEVRLADLKKTIAHQQAALNQSISIEGLDESATFAIKTLKNELSHWDNVRSAALAVSGYDPLQVEAAMALRDREEVRAFENLLTRPTWRQRVVLWLLSPRRAHQ
jgi:chromosome segregation ATPase